MPTGKSKGTILIADSDFGELDLERTIVEGSGFELVAAQCKSEDDVIEHGRDADGVLAQYARVGKRAIDAFTRCKVIARYGTGVDIIDVDAATRRGIQVTNAPNDWCAEEVADHAISLWLAAARKICEYDQSTRRGEWRWQTGQPIWKLRGRVFGLLSFGAIARLVADRARPFGVDIWAHDPFQDEADGVFNSALPYEFAVLREAALPLLETVSPKEQEYPQARFLHTFLEGFVPIPVRLVPPFSLLREFLGQSGFHY